MDPHANPDRHAFLHTPECNALWRLWVKCKKEHPILYIAVDHCGDDYARVLKCFKKERRQKKANNHQLADKERNQVINRLAQKNIESDS